ncbi:hypothetical protein [Polyangium fumosum]|uniref:Uncharacterized protein n=1 Tax=Polyangium fumosum TaxID=889272 RepID=A0A4U1I9C6_9BACT|nr:hypothetical protein [Polyangium fumosum]TKC90007.1 hypothetical protein E8A74_51255 [Polyangium fumosum]
MVLRTAASLIAPEGDAWPATDAGGAAAVWRIAASLIAPGGDAWTAADAGGAEAIGGGDVTGAGATSSWARRTDVRPGATGGAEAVDDG